MASRPATLSAAFIPVLAGTAVAFYLGKARWDTALAALVGAVWIQIGTNFANDVYDYEKGTDDEERVGPTRTAQAGLLSASALKRGMIVAFTLATLAGVYLTITHGWPIVVIGIASILSGIAYTGGPYPLGYHGLGDLFVFVFFGFVAVCGTVFVQMNSVPSLAYFVSAGIGAIATTILVVNNVRDREGDALSGKATLVVRFGFAAGIAEYGVLLLFSFGIPAYLIVFESMQMLLLVYLALPLAIKTWYEIYSWHGAELNRTLKKAAMLMVAYGILLSVGVVMSAP